jgi:hypothetical protein
MSILPVSGPIPVSRREIISLYLILQHNEQQAKIGESVSPARRASVMVNPTTGILFDERTGEGQLNDFLTNNPGLSSTIRWPNQMKRIVDVLCVAGLLERNGRVLVPTEHGELFIRSIIKRYGTSPFNWPASVEVEDGSPNWSTVKTSEHALADND